MSAERRFGFSLNLVRRRPGSALPALDFCVPLVLACGLTLHLFVVLPVLLYLVGGINPIVHFRNMVEPLVMAFSTSSSGATLPVTMNAVEKRVGVSNRVTSFVLPMGATVNMDGTALYECAGVLFIAQVLGVTLGWGAAPGRFAARWRRIGAAAGALRRSR